MKNYDIDRILIPAFKLFLTHNYEKVTATELEKATGLKRGVIFFKNKNKLELFQAVIDRFVLKTLSAQERLSDIQGVGLKEFYDTYLLRIRATMERMMSFNIENTHRSYFGLIYQAIAYYPGFQEKIIELFQNELGVWERVVTQAKESGEIDEKIDIKLVALQFRLAYTGLSFEGSLAAGLDVDRLQNLFDYYYDNIKT